MEFVEFDSDEYCSGDGDGSIKFGQGFQQIIEVEGDEDVQYMWVVVNEKEGVVQVVEVIGNDCYLIYLDSVQQDL